MMRRRGAVGRRGPGLLGTMARTAVVAGTATAVAKGVSGSMDQKAAQQQAAAQQQQQQQAAYDAGVQQAQLQAQQEPLAQQQQHQILAAQASPPPVASPGSTTDTTIRQLQQLAELQKQGILTPEEFAQQKAMILGGGRAS
jgi:hypothetical protein